MSEPAIVAIRSGGQSGVDRGALDAARALGVTICGWCPSGGCAEDYPDPPGLLLDYPELTPTPSSAPQQRTRWNVRDSDLVLILAPRGGARSAGTDFTRARAHHYQRPVLEVTLGVTDPAATAVAIAQVGRGLVVNVAGPRESEVPGCYDMSQQFITGLLARGIAGSTTHMTMSEQ